MRVAIVTDSTADLPKSTIEQHGIGVVPLYINIGDKSFLDGVDMTREEFYTGLPNFDKHPTTAVPGIDAFVNIYNQAICWWSTRHASSLPDFLGRSCPEAAKLRCCCSTNWTS